MAKGLNIDEILASLEQEKTAEENFAEGVSSEENVEKEAPATEATSEEVATEAPEATESTDSEEKVAESTEEANNDGETEKVAAEMDAQGRIMAQAFMDELQKIAVGDSAYIPHNDDAKKDQKELMKGDVPEGGKVDAVVAKLKELEGVARSGSYVQHGDSPAPAPAKSVDESFGSTSSDMGKAASAEETEETPEARIVGSLYDQYFAAEEGGSDDE
tara:strand:+ start:360 stop:1010 length:651 start_codon:yes stop_codon:yes gene_type:complete